MSTGLITLLMFGFMLVAIMGGVPVAFALGGISTILTILLLGPQSLYISVSNVWGLMSEFLLVAIPLFVFMANVLQHSGVADDLYELVYHWMGPLRGGLAIGTIGICTIMAAMTGISATATISMGVIALPSMLKRGYNPHIAIGTVAAGGALGVLIPPSVLMILYGQLAQVSVGKLFVGGGIPWNIARCSFCGLCNSEVCLAKEAMSIRPTWRRHQLGEEISASVEVTYSHLYDCFGFRLHIFGDSHPLRSSCCWCGGKYFCCRHHPKTYLENDQRRVPGMFGAYLHVYVDHDGRECLQPSLHGYGGSTSDPGGGNFVTR